MGFWDNSTRRNALELRILTVSLDDFSLFSGVAFELSNVGENYS